MKPTPKAEAIISSQYPRLITMVLLTPDAQSSILIAAQEFGQVVAPRRTSPHSWLLLVTEGYDTQEVLAHLQSLI